MSRKKHRKGRVSESLNLDDVDLNLDGDPHLDDDEDAIYNPTDALDVEQSDSDDESLDDEGEHFEDEYRPMVTDNFDPYAGPE